MEIHCCGCVAEDICEAVQGDNRCLDFHKALEAVKTSHNSDYAAALRVMGELRASNSNACYTVDLEQWCKLRLNSAKPNIA